MRLTPIEYIKATANRVVFTETITADSVQSIMFTCLNIDNLELYQNCSLEIIVGGAVLSGKYRKLIDGSNVFYQDSINIPIALNPTTEAYTYSTFKATKDNQTLTKKDILRELIAKPIKYGNGAMTDFGVGGIVTADDKMKIDASYSWFVQAPLTLNTNFQDIAKIKNPSFDIKLGFYDGVSQFMFDGKCSIVTARHINTNTKVTLKVIEVVGDLFTYYIVSAKIDENELTVDFSINTSSHQSILNVIPVNFVESSRQNLIYKDIFDEDITEIEFIPGITQYNQTKIVTSNEYPGLSVNSTIVLTDDIDLDSIVIPGYYSGTNTVENYTFFLTVLKKDASIIQNLQLIDGTSNLQHRSKINDTWNEWITSNKHEHLATDIVEDDEHQFVTIDEKAAIGSIADSPWKPAVLTFEDLVIEYPNPEAGWCVTVLSTNINYEFNGDTWQPQSINALVTATKDINGLLSKELFAEISRLSFSRVVPNKGVVWRGNTDLMYGVNFEFLGLNAIDLVSRVSALTQKIGDNSILFGENLFSSGNNSINIGKNNNSSGAAAILLGQYLNSTTDNQVIFGKYNADFSGVFAIGFGNETTPKNLLELGIGGIIKVLGGYSINGKDSTDILLADGTTRKVTDFLTSNTFKNNAINFTLVDEDDEIVEIQLVQIPIIKYAVTITQVTGGTITVTLNGNPVTSGDLIRENSSVIITNTPSGGFMFSKYLVNGVESTSPVMVTSAMVISAEFVVNP